MYLKQAIEGKELRCAFGCFLAIFGVDQVLEFTFPHHDSTTTRTRRPLGENGIDISETWRNGHLHRSRREDITVGRIRFLQWANLSIAWMQVWRLEFNRPLKHYTDKKSDKKQRDQQIDQNRATGGSDVVPHKNEEKRDPAAGTRVTDPTTGKQVVIEDVNDQYVERSKNPMLSVPNANLGKDTPVKTDSSQSGAEYKEMQDITAPPDPVAEGSTSDVPIHGEKTNILFHPTPSVSYEATFKSLEQRGLYLVVGVFVGIIVLGRTFGGRFIGIIPLAACVASGIWLWVKEVVRSGREVEWSAEKERGQVATANLLPESVEW